MRIIIIDRKLNILLNIESKGNGNQQNPEVSMKFMCNMCRQHLAAEPERAYDFWKGAVRKANKNRDALQWDAAITAYGNALDAADILLDQKDSPKEDLERYLRTAQEMTYALRKGGYFGDLDAFVLTVEARLSDEVLPKPVVWYLRPLKDVAENPICAVDMWMNTLAETFRFSSKQVVH
jgi:hypothetical protein